MVRDSDGGGGEGGDEDADGGQSQGGGAYLVLAYAGPVSARRRRIRQAATLLTGIRTKGGTAV